jgi:hypothetical protein
LPIRNAKHRQNQLLFAQGVNSNFSGESVACVWDRPGRNPPFSTYFGTIPV